MAKKKRAHPIGSAFGMLMKNITHDGMLLAVLLAPPLLGAVFRFGVPALVGVLPVLSVVMNYQSLFDALLFLVTPMMPLFAACMVALEERDNKLATALSATPLGKGGYMVSRFVLPLLLGVMYAAVIGVVFASVHRPLVQTLLLCPLGGLCALAAMGIIPAFSRDKIAGMGMAKLCGLPLLAVAIPYFLPMKWQPLLSWLPAYWFYRYGQTGDWLMAVLCVVVSLAWIVPLMRRFMRRALR